MRKRCYNCKHSGKQFRLGNLTHLHCLHPKYDELRKTGKNVSPWETLCVFSDTCNDHKLKQLNKSEVLK